MQSFSNDNKYTDGVYEIHGGDIEKVDEVESSKIVKEIINSLQIK